MNDSCSNEPDLAEVEPPQLPSEPQSNGLEERPDSIVAKKEVNEVGVITSFYDLFQDKVVLIPSSAPSQEQLLRKFIDDEQKLNQADYTKRFFVC